MLMHVRNESQLKVIGCSARVSVALKRARRWFVPIMAMLLGLVFNVFGQQDKGAEEYMNYTIVANLDYEVPLAQNISGAIEAFCDFNGRAPSNVEELLFFCIEADYHPNDMILDDFDLRLLRIMHDYNGFYLIYFIGPDFVDDRCNRILSMDEIDTLTYRGYKNYKGDIVLGGMENIVIQKYKEKFLLNGN